MYQRALNQMGIDTSILPSVSFYLKVILLILTSMKWENSVLLIDIWSFQQAQAIKFSSKINSWSTDGFWSFLITSELIKQITATIRLKSDRQQAWKFEILMEDHKEE
jgi:hypothetical protein